MNQSLKRNQGYYKVSRTMNLEPEKSERIYHDLKNAVRRIEDLQDELKSVQIDERLGMKLSELKEKFNKYVLIGSDCSWQEDDGEIDHCLMQIDMCYGILMRKTTYTVGDLILMNQTLDNILVMFEEKIAVFSELYGI